MIAIRKSSYSPHPKHYRVWHCGQTDVSVFNLSMPDTIVKALLSLQIAPQIPILDLPSCSRNVLRILAIETVSTAKSTPPELESTKQDISFGALLILLHAATIRKQSGPPTAVTLQQKELDIRERGQGEDYRRLEEQLRQLSVKGSHRLYTKFTWIVAQRTEFAIDQD